MCLRRPVQVDSISTNESDDNSNGYTRSNSDGNEELCVEGRALRRDRRVVGDFRNPIQSLNRYFDDDGFPRFSLESTTVAHRQLLYGYCCLNEWAAPVVIRRNEKGRAVYAAKALCKYDYICGKRLLVSLCVSLG